MSHVSSLALSSLAIALTACVHQPHISCGAPISIPDAVYAARVLLLGEIHGTEEMPRFAGDLACNFVARGQSVVLALEFPHNEQMKIDAYLESDGGKNSRLALVDSKSWRQLVDGRATVAIANAIEKIRLLKRAGYDARVLAMDNSWGIPNLPGTRDEVMARFIDEAAKRLAPSGAVIVLSGNAHAARRAQSRGSKVNTPMGHLLKTNDVISFNVSYDGGTASELGAPPGGSAWDKNSGGAPTQVRSFMLFDQPDERGFSGTFHVGRIHASPHVAMAWLGQ